MSRLDTVRTYFIEKFLTAISTDSQLPGLTYPAELFDPGGAFNVTPDTAGFRRIPTPKNLIRRIGATADPNEKADLITFLRILLRAINQITGGLGTIDSKMVMELAKHYAPQIRQRTEQTFVPTSVEDYLNFQDATLAGHFHDAGGRQPLTGNIFDLMFENPTIPALAGIPQAPYQARVPFVATVGIDPSVAPYPANPLNVGRLNLSAADARFTLGQIQPTVYVEMKAVLGSLILNREYDRAASFPGRFAPLRNNRIHKDPLVDLPGFRVPQHAMVAPIRGGSTEEARNESEAAASRAPVGLTGRFPSATAIRDLLQPTLTAGLREGRGLVDLDGVAFGVDDAVERETPAIIPDAGPYMLIYHFFYPMDDEARKRGKVNSTNREGHHLAVGLLLQGGRRLRASSGLFQASHLLISRGPDNVQVIPFNHPVLTRLRDDGTEDPNGLHAVFYTVWRSPLAIAAGAGAGALTAWIAEEAGAGDEYIAALATLASIAAAAAASGAWPAAAVAVILFIIVLLFCIFTGCGSDDSDVFEDEPAPGSDSYPLISDPEYQNPNSYVAPGPAAPGGIQAALRLIPHQFDLNLYGLHGGGDDQFEIKDHPKLKEMLGWVAFPGGLGYPVEREFPGKQDVPGSSWRNYFDIFVEKLIEVRDARQRVNYFGP